LFASTSDPGTLLFLVVVVSSGSSLVAIVVSVLRWPCWYPVVGAFAGVAGGVVVVFVVPGAVFVSSVGDQAVSVEETVACFVAFVVAGGVAVPVVDAVAVVVAEAVFVIEAVSA